jgi:hypothetical protein
MKIGTLEKFRMKSILGVNPDRGQIRKIVRIAKDRSIDLITATKQYGKSQGLFKPEIHEKIGDGFIKTEEGIVSIADYMEEHPYAEITFITKLKR